MKELDIKLGYNCNNKCLFCLNQDKRILSYSSEELKEQIKKSAESGCQRLIVSGGEPLIYGNFFEIIQYAKRCGIPSYEIQTNGRMLSYEEVVKKIKEICVNVGFLVSFHYPNAEMYQKYSQVDGFDQVLKGLKNLQKNNLEFTTNTVLFKGNIDYLNQIFDILEKIGCKISQLRFIDGTNVKEEFFDFVPKMEEVVPKIKEVILKHPNIKIYIHEIPYCLLGEELIKFISPVPNVERENYNIRKSVLNSREIVNQQFATPNCEECVYKNQCVGIRKTYLEFYGDKEIKPILKKYD
ncbi:MAG: radical SAM protein [Clostridia bacterium]|nr:radical SAM protein [Clostridia bacterium]